MYNKAKKRGNARMGFHTCEYCQQQGVRTPATSSGDVVLTFATGQRYCVPDMLPHYIRAHGYLPPQPLIEAVLSGQFVEGERWQTKAVAEQVGYLSGPDYPRGSTPPVFVFALMGMLACAQQDGMRRQTRGAERV